MRWGARNLTHNQAEFKHLPHILLRGPLAKIVTKIGIFPPPTTDSGCGLYKFKRASESHQTLRLFRKCIDIMEISNITCIIAFEICIVVFFHWLVF